jgi:hypothetical protein
MPGQTMNACLKLSQVEALTILEALKRGSVPIEYAELLAVEWDFLQFASTWRAGQASVWCS